MDKELKEELLQELRDEGSYLDGVSGVRSSGERKQIKAFAEDVYLSLIEGMLSVGSAIEQSGVELDVDEIPRE